MATLRQKGDGAWQVRFRVGTQQFERSIGTAVKRDADDRLGEIRQTLRLLKEGFWEAPEGVNLADWIVSGGRLKPRKEQATILSLRQAWEAYQASFPAGSKEQTTLSTERIHMRHFMRLLGENRPFAEITAQDLQTAYINRRAEEKGRRGKVAGQTIRKELATFSLVWGKTFPDVRCPVNRRLSVPKRKQREPFRELAEVERMVGKTTNGIRRAELWECVFLTMAEIREALEIVRQSETSPPFLFPMLATAAYTGGRRSELMRSEVEDICFEQGIIRLRECKRDKTTWTYRDVPLHEALQAILRAWLANHPGCRWTFFKPTYIGRNGKPVRLTGNAANTYLKAALEGSRYAKIPGWHTFRHSFASNLALAGTDPTTVDEWMGHQTEEMRKRYRHLFRDTQRTAINAL